MNSRRGLAILSFSIAAGVLVPVLGLALDSGMLCVVKERLTAATELSARASRVYPAGNPKREAAVQRFLDANFPEGFLGTSRRTVTVNNNQLEVRVDAPTYFLKMLRWQYVEVSASGNLAE